LTGLATATIGLIVGMKTTQVCTDDPIGGTDAWGQPLTIHNCQENFPNFTPGIVMFSLGLTTMIVPLLIHDSAEIAPTGR
jgi:hypothetical protein